MVGWPSSMPTERSQTQASPPVWLATTLSSRSRTGSARALSVRGQLDRRVRGQGFAHQRRGVATGHLGQRQQ